jgi:hypothetical protein
MFGSRILEVAIGIIFVFLLVSMICSAIREGIESWVKARAAFLEQGIRELLHDRHAVGIARSLYTHPLIYGLYAAEYHPRSATRKLNAFTPGRDLPSYSPSRSFALALLDIAARGTGMHGTASSPAAPELSLALARVNVLNLENGPVQRVVLGAIDLAHGDMELAIANIAAWYDSAMDRVSGAYKRATQKLLLGIGLTVAVVLNVNIIAIAHHLFRDDVERATIVARAESIARDSSFIGGGSQAQYARARSFSTGCTTAGRRRARRRSAGAPGSAAGTRRRTIRRSADACRGFARCRRRAGRAAARGCPARGTRPAP